MRKSSLLLLAVACALLAFGLPHAARAATYSTSCPAGDASCAALAERLETLVALQESSNALLAGWDANGLGTILRGVDVPAGTSGNPRTTAQLPVAVEGVWMQPGAFEPRQANELPVSDSMQRDLIDDGATTKATATAVRLSTTDRGLLDQAWWGIWALVGVSLCSLIAPVFFKAFRFWRE